MDPSLLRAPMPAPQPQRSGGISRGVLFAIIGVTLAIIIGSALIFVSSDHTASLRDRYSVRQANLIELTDSARKNISSPDLAKLNSELYLVLLSDSADTNAALGKLGLSKKPSADITSAESIESTLSDLNSAKVNGQFDTVYKRTLKDSLTSMTDLAQELYDKTPSKALKAVLATEYEHLSDYNKQLESLKL